MEKQNLNTDTNKLDKEIEEQLKLNKQSEECYQKLGLKLDSLIKSVDEYNLLKKWITDTNGTSSNLELTLLYNSLVDTDSAEIFHSKCDNKGKTLSIIESEHGLRFGGFTTLTWESIDKGSWKENDPTAFIFSLTNMKKLRCITQSCVIYCNKDSNVVYGADIYIKNNFTSNDNTSLLGHSYDASGIDNKDDYLAGACEFKVKRIEVYKVDLE